MNLVRDMATNVPPFGITKFLKFFTESVSRQDWEKLEMSCLKNEEENCKNYCLSNPFLKYYSDFEKIKSRNKDVALEYLKGLKAGAFFSGMVPGLDIGMEYYYRKIFKDKLKTLYGFDYNIAEEQIKGGNKKDENKINLTEEDIKQSINNVQEEEKLIEDKIDKEVQNKGRNAGAIIRGAGEIGGVIIKALPTAAVEGAQVATRFAVNGLLKAASWAIFPITCSAFGAWSCVNIHKDCIKILDIFDKAFTPLRYKTLYAYVLSFELALEYLDQIGNKIIEDDKLENS